jgi:hypothetical protein
LSRYAVNLCPSASMRPKSSLTMLIFPEASCATSNASVAWLILTAPPRDTTRRSLGHCLKKLLLTVNNENYNPLGPYISTTHRVASRRLVLPSFRWYISDLDAVQKDSLALDGSQPCDRINRTDSSRDCRYSAPA